MDTSSNNDYCIPVSEPLPGESAIYRRSLSKDGLTQTKFENLNTMQKWLLSSFEKQKQHNALGTFNVEKQDYDFIKYEVFLLMIQGTSLIDEFHWKCIDYITVSTLDHRSIRITIKPVGIYSNNRQEWGVVDVACQLFGLTSLTFYDTLGPSSISYGIKLTQCTTCFCVASTAQHLAKSQDLSTLKNVVIFGEIPQTLTVELQEKQINVIQYDTLLDFGRANLQPYPDDVFPYTPLTISFTSGTTGDPKGVVQTHGNFTAMSSNQAAELNDSDVHLCYLPLHLYRECKFVFTLEIYQILRKTSSGQGLLYLQVFQGQSVSFIKKIFNRYYDAILAGFQALPQEKRNKVEEAVQIKLKEYHRTGSVVNQELDTTVFANTKNLFGGRQRLMITAAAPISNQILDFLKVVLCCPILEAYGQTESTGGGFLTNVDDGTSGHVGGCSFVIECKLVDIPDMEYLSTDIIDGINCPRGEICLRGPTIMVGYFGQPEITRETIDKDGWLHTGDVGMIQPNCIINVESQEPQRQQIVRRTCLNFRRQNTYRQKRQKTFTSELWECLNALFMGTHPNPIQRLIKELLCRHSGPRQYYHCKARIDSWYQDSTASPKALNEHGTAEKLYGFEQIKNVHLEPKSFAQVGVLTDTQKMQRFAARKHYLDIIQELYKEIGE